MMTMRKSETVGEWTTRIQGWPPVDLDPIRQAIDQHRERIRSHSRQVTEACDREIEAAIHRFRDCGVEIERFSIVHAPHLRLTALCVDGVPRFQVKITEER